VIGSDWRLKAVLPAIKAAVPASTKVTEFGSSDPPTTSRYISELAENSFGMSWNGVAFSTSLNWPDALAGGPLQGSDGSFIILNPPDRLDGDIAGKLMDRRAQIDTVKFLGGSGVTPLELRANVFERAYH
jgi:hypothetical protein